MATDVVMPQMGESIAEGTITKWLKNVGDHVDRDEPLFEISTDKVDAEIPAPAAGTLTEIKFKEGETGRGQHGRSRARMARRKAGGGSSRPRRNRRLLRRRLNPAPVETKPEEPPATIEPPKPVIPPARRRQTGAAPLTPLTKLKSSNW